MSVIGMGRRVVSSGVALLVTGSVAGSRMRMPGATLQAHNVAHIATNANHRSPTPRRRSTVRSFIHAVNIPISSTLYYFGRYASTVDSTPQTGRCTLSQYASCPRKTTLEVLKKIAGPWRNDQLFTYETRAPSKSHNPYCFFHSLATGPSSHQGASSDKKRGALHTAAVSFSRIGRCPTRLISPHNTLI